MREVDAAVPRGDLGQLDDLVGGREAIGHVLQRRAHAERALLHRLRHDLSHLVELRRRGAPIVLANDVVPDAAGADEGGDVDRRVRSLLEPLEIFAERAEVLRDAEMRVGRLRILHHAVVDRRNRRSFAGDLGRHPLQDLARRAAVDQHVELRLPEQIDEAGRDHQVRRVDRDRCRGTGKRTDGGDAIAADGDVTAEPRRAGAVDNPAIPDQDVEPGLRRLGVQRRGGDGRGGESEQASGGAHAAHRTRSVLARRHCVLE